jgi:valyl-tRNA synthetase
MTHGDALMIGATIANKVRTKQEITEAETVIYFLYKEVEHLSQQVDHGMYLKKEPIPEVLITAEKENLDIVDEALKKIKESCIHFPKGD